MSWSRIGEKGMLDGVVVVVFAKLFSMESNDHGCNRAIAFVFTV